MSLCDGRSIIPVGHGPAEYRIQYTPGPHRLVSALPVSAKWAI